MYKGAPIGAKTGFSICSINRVLLWSRYLLKQSAHLTPEESPVYRNKAIKLEKAPWEPPNGVHYYFNAFVP
jgi:hypothetical protein